MTWSNWRVASRLLFTVLSQFGLLLIVGVGVQWEIYRANQAALSAVREFDKRIVDAVRWRGLAEVAFERSIAALGTTDGDLLVEYEKSVAESEKNIVEIRGRLSSEANGDEDQRLLEEISVQHHNLLKLMEKGRAYSGKGDVGGVQSLVQSDIAPSVAAELRKIDQFIALQTSQRDGAVAENEVQFSRLTTMASFACVGLLLLGLICTFLLLKSISSPLRDAVQLAQSIADGDLRAKIETSRRDEFGQLLISLDRMAERLREIVLEVRVGVDSVSTASREIAAGTQELSYRTENAATQLQVTSTNVEQLTASVAASADAAGQADRLAGESTTSAEAGGQLVHAVVNQMTLIEQSSSKIVSITNLIDGIAAQTRLLAMNAAVEAARAGDHGRGFAVVAQEVQMLAKRSGEASKEIRELTESVTSFVATGSQMVERAEKAMGMIVKNTKSVGVLIGEISAVTGQQHSGLDGISRSVGDIDNFTQQNAALVEESAAAAVALNEQAQRLAELVSVFTLPESRRVIQMF